MPNAMEGALVLPGSQAVGPVELGPSSIAEPYRELLLLILRNHAKRIQNGRNRDQQ